MKVRNTTYILLLGSLILSLICHNASAQSKKCGEIGLTLGGSYYLGELNKTPFVGTKLAVGAFYRHTFDTRFALKGNFTYGKLSGDAENTNFKNPNIVSFNNAFYEASGLLEYNFLQFLPGNKKFVYTPYVFGGLGCAYYSKETALITSIPFGIGVKYNLNSNFIIGAFVGMHKTLAMSIKNKSTISDEIDYRYNDKPSPSSPIEQWSYNGNKDWYSVFGVSLSYKIKYRMKCPAFD